MAGSQPSSSLWVQPDFDALDLRAPYLDLWDALQLPDGSGFYPCDRRAPQLAGYGRQPSGGLERHPHLCDALAAVAENASGLVWNEPAGATNIVDWMDRAGCGAKARKVVARNPLTVSVEGPHVRISPYCPVRDLDKSARHVSVPYPTHYRLTSPPKVDMHVTTALYRRRVNLMAVFAGIHGQAAELRRFLHAECDASASCRTLVNRNWYRNVISDELLDIQKVYSVSDFCLQPEGDTPTRQSWFDAAINLCIPVFFSDCLEPNLLFETEYDHFLPPVRKRAAFGAGVWAVLLNASAVLARPGVLVEQLESISTEERSRMRATLAKSVPKLLYTRSAARGGTLPRGSSVPAKLLARLSGRRVS